jgi:hypothetical protein
MTTPSRPDLHALIAKAVADELAEAEAARDFAEAADRLRKTKNQLFTALFEAGYRGLGTCGLVASGRLWYADGDVKSIPVEPLDD